MTIDCPNGHKNESNSAFCNTCGEQISPAVVTPVAESKPRPKWFLPTVIAAPAAVVIAVVLGVVSPILNPPTHHLQGALSLWSDSATALSSDPDMTGDWQNCSGTGGYDDFSAGTAATIRNGEGDIVGSLSVTNFDAESLDAMLAADQKYELGGWGDDAEEAKSTIESAADMGFLCMLYVSGDIEDADYYTFEFSHRGELSYSREELEAQGWWISTTLGSTD
jgi:hypothetical protein